MVLSETTAKILQTLGTTETFKTAKYCQKLDQFFDYLDVRSQEKHENKRNLFLKPYINENNERFCCMTNQFLPYLNT